MAPPGIGGWFDEFTGVYSALAQLGVDPRRADALEVWEVAAMMGLHAPHDPATPTPAAGERDLIAERLAYARGEGPKPEPDRPAPTDPAVSNLIRRYP